jgi:hypothetical protein
MILVIQNERIFARHTDEQAITIALYPAADRIIRVPNTWQFPNTNEPQNIPDPTLADPALLLEILDDAHPILDAAKTTRIKQCETAMHTFIDSVLPQKTQTAFLTKQVSLLTRAKKKTLSAAEDTALMTIAAFEPWTSAVTQRFYEKAQAIMAEATIEAVNAVSWDFASEFGAAGTIFAKPDTSLSSVIGI